jgi:DNA modification methylase
MTEFNIINGDCFEEIKKLNDNSIDLIITSPPYSDIISYGKDIDVKKPSEYVDWLLPIFNEIYRVLKPSGSFILNINDSCNSGYRNTFVYELIYRSSKETRLKFYDSYIWHKKTAIPNGSKKRFRNTTEFIFHFCKDRKQMKFYMNRVLKEQKLSSKNRLNYEIFDYQGDVVDGVRKNNKKIRQQPDKVRPDNVVRFSTSSASRDNIIRHPAPFNKELPLYYINLLTDKNDIVLDIFSGIGTTGIACKDLDRNYIGFELNKIYCDFSKKRILEYERYNKI